MINVRRDPDEASLEASPDEVSGGEGYRRLPGREITATVRSVHPSLVYWGSNHLD